ncbi:MAG: hypothetical protein ACREX9_02190 [Gammaproteobacteria bacterium]
MFSTLRFIIRWSRSQGTAAKWTSLLLKEVLHWGGLLLALQLAYTLLSAGNIPRAPRAW